MALLCISIHHMAPLYVIIIVVQLLCLTFNYVYNGTLSKTNRMPTASPRQAVLRIPNKPATRKSDQKDYYKPEAILALGVTRGHYGWCHSTEDKIAYIFFSRYHMPISRSFGVTTKNEISEKESWLLWQRPLKNQKSRFRFIYSHSATER